MSGREAVVPVVAAFMFAYLFLVLLTALVGALGGSGVLESLTAALGMVGNIGPTFVDLGPTSNYASVPAPVKWWYCFAMLAGRLELYTMFILAGRILPRLSRERSA